MKKPKLALMIALGTILLIGLENFFFSYIDSSPAKNLTVGGLEAPLGMNNDVPVGGVSVLDFEKPIAENISITSLQILSHADSNQVRLKVWRLKGNNYKVTGETKLLTLTKGVNSFSVDNILAKKGDFLGMYFKTSEIDRSAKYKFQGRVYVLGDMDFITKETKSRDGQTGYTFSVNGTSCWLCQPSFKELISAFYPLP